MNEVDKGAVMINQIHNEDALITMARMPDNFVDLTITSPPYDNLRIYYDGQEFDFKPIAKELFRITKPGGVVVWVVGDQTINGSESGTSFRQVLYFMNCGFNLHDTMIYRKKNYIPLTHNRYEQSFEYMFILSKGVPKTFNPLLQKTGGGGDDYNLSRKGYCSTIKEGAQRRRNEDITIKDLKIKPNIFTYTCGALRTNHPAPFPEKLAGDHIVSWSNEGDLVYDPMAGSGTTLKMAKIHNRKFIGSERVKEYCEIAKERIKQEELFSPK